LPTAKSSSPTHVLQIAWRVHHRLYRLNRRLRQRGKPAHVVAVAVAVAVARELACFLWAMAS
jgi:hypothetical protein